jgi:hypothetical protein
VATSSGRFIAPSVFEHFYVHLVNFLTGCHNLYTLIRQRNQTDQREKSIT